MPSHLLAPLVLIATLVLLTGCAGARSAMPWRTAQTQVRPSTAEGTATSGQPSRDRLSSTQTRPLSDDDSSGESEIALTSAAEPDAPPLLTPDPAEPIPGEAVPASSWTLASLESAALANNPAIRQASASAHKAIGFHDQVGTKPNPTIGYTGSQLADEGTDQHAAFVEQDIITGGKLVRNRAVLSHEIQSQLWEVEAQRYRVLTDVRRHYYEALAAQRRLTLATEFRAIIAKGVEVAKARVEAKEGSVPEVLQAEIQLNQIEVQSRQAEAAFRGAWNQLMAVAGISGTVPGALAGTLPTSFEIRDLEGVKELALNSSPELQAARARISRARANVDRQNVQAVPNLSLLLAAGVDNGTNSGMINTQVGLPVPIYNRNLGNIAAANAELSRACEEARRIELSIESRMARGVQEYEAAAAAVEQYQQIILPKAEQTLRLLEEAYAAGQFGFLEVLVARRTYFDSNLEYVLAQSNLAAAQAYLDGMALSGGLENTRDTELDSGLRDQSLSGQ